VTVNLTPKLVRESREGAGRLMDIPLGEAESHAQIDHESRVVGDGAEVNGQRGLEAQLAAEKATHFLPDLGAREPRVKDGAVVSHRVAKLGDREHEARHEVGVSTLEPPAPRHSHQCTIGELLEEPREVPERNDLEQRPGRCRSSRQPPVHRTWRTGSFWKANR